MTDKNQKLFILGLGMIFAGDKLSVQKKAGIFLRFQVNPNHWKLS